MTAVVRHLWILVLVLGLVALAMGAAFIYQGIAKENLVQTAMRQEKVTYLLPKEEVAKGNVIDTAEEAQMVADTIKQHRQSIAPTYDDLLAGGKYDPTNPKHLSYSQAINMENYLYLAVLAFGLITVVEAAGIFMAITGIAFILTSLVLRVAVPTPALPARTS
jgi:hypothetical protein